MGKKTILTGFLLFAILTLTLTNLSNAIENVKVEGLDPNLASLILLLILVQQLRRSLRSRLPTKSARVP